MEKLVLIGVGLIGGSFALDLKRCGMVKTVLGIDANPKHLALALERHIIDEAASSIETADLSGASLVLIATPVAVMPTICAALAGRLPAGVIVSDVGSTKQSAIDAFLRYLPEHFSHCVAAHPIAGSDRSGAAAAKERLFEGKNFIVCPHEGQNAAALQQLSDWWRQLGARVCVLSATEHDAVFAAVSHLPHLLAYAYVHQIATMPNRVDMLHFAGSGFRDFTRIAASHPDVWTDICMSNRHSLQTLLQQQQNELAFLQKCLDSGDAAALRHYFRSAKSLREMWK